MRVLIVHPVMAFLGGGERLCCETVRALLSHGHEITILSERFDPRRIETFFGYGGLFARVNLMFYTFKHSRAKFGTSSHVLHHLRAQRSVLNEINHVPRRRFDLIFSTQDAGYIPDLTLPVIQWGYFPRPFIFPNSFPKTLRSLPLRLHYDRKISRIGLVLAISQYSKRHFDKEWGRPTALVYPACNMVSARPKRDLVVTVARAAPEKQLELFWVIARTRPEYEFAMLLTQVPHYKEYSDHLSRIAPENGRTIFNPPKEEYHKFLGEAKVYLHLMTGEHFGITVVEAMSALCVPVVHDSGGPKEFVDGGSGLRWRKTEEIPGLVDEAMKRSPSGESGKKAENFDYQKFDKRLSSIFSSIHP